MATKIKLTKCALRYHPPTMVLFYTDMSTGKYRRRSIPLRAFDSQVNISEYATSLFNHSRHKSYFSNIKRDQLESLLERVRKAQDIKINLLPTKKAEKSKGSTTLTHLGALPHLSKGVTSRSGCLDIDDSLNRILNQTEDLVIEEEFEGTPFEITKAKCDDELDQVFNSTNEDVQKLLGHKTTKNAKSSLPPLSSLPPISTSKSFTTGKDALPTSTLDTVTADKSSLKSPRELLDNDDYSLSKEVLSVLSEELEKSSNDEEDTPLMSSDHFKALDNARLVSSDEEEGLSCKNDEDFNKLAETDYEKRKSAMEREFEGKRIKPTDPGYIYDKEVEFDVPKMESGWDDDTSDSVSDEF